MPKCPACGYNPESKTQFGKEVRQVFNHWRATLDHRAARLTSPRRSTVEARLREGYTVDQCKRAIDGGKVAVYTNPVTGRCHDDLTVILRGNKIDEFIAIVNKQRPDSFIDDLNEDT